MTQLVHQLLVEINIYCSIFTSPLPDYAKFKFKNGHRVLPPKKGSKEHIMLRLLCPLESEISYVDI